MKLDDLLAEITIRGIRLKRRGDSVIIQGNPHKLDPALISSIKTYKEALLAVIDSEDDHQRPAPTSAITPAMLPLIKLKQSEIDGIVEQVPGGVANVQDIYGLAPLQEGIFFHHLIATDGDPYLITSLIAFESRERLEAYLAALRAVIQRHDILRTAIFWKGLPEPVQVVLRSVELPLEETEITGNDAVEQLRARSRPDFWRMNLNRAPLLRGIIAYDRQNGRWLMLLIQHHIIGDGTTTELLQHEVQAHLLGQEQTIPAPQPFRNLVAQAKFGTRQEDHEAFFREMLGDVEEVTAPFNVLEVREKNVPISEFSITLRSNFADRVRATARQAGVTAASVCHLAWALVLGRVSGRDDVVFGTVLFGRANLAHTFETWAEQCEGSAAPDSQNLG
jgi:hypothetical protein